MIDVDKIVRDAKFPKVGKYDHGVEAPSDIARRHAPLGCGDCGGNVRRRSCGESSLSRRSPNPPKQRSLMTKDSWPVMLVCGGRHYNNVNTLYNTLTNICVRKKWITKPDEYGNFLPRVKLIQGGAKGADFWADQWAIINWVDSTTYHPDWDKDGKAAGFIRNQRMLDEGKPDLVVAFPGGVGTADMVRRARKAGVEVMEIK